MANVPAPLAVINQGAVGGVPAFLPAVTVYPPAGRATATGPIEKRRMESCIDLMID